MKNSEDQIKALLALGEDALPAWLIDCASGSICAPLANVPGDYDNPLDFLIDSLRDLKDAQISTIIGNAACEAFRTLFDRGGFSIASARRTNREIAINLLFLVESLPCAPEVAVEFCQYLLLLLANRAYRVLTDDEIDLRARMLLALASKLSPESAIKPELAFWLQEDFDNPNYVVPAFSVALRLNPAYASEHLGTAFTCLRANGLPTKYLVFETIKVLTITQVSKEQVFGAIKRLGDENLRQEFKEALQRLKSTALLRAYLDILQKAPPTPRDEIISLAPPLATNSDALTRNESISVDQYIIRCSNAFRNNPILIGKDISNLLWANYLFMRRSAEDRPLFPNRDSVLTTQVVPLVQYLDNGHWGQVPLPESMRDWFSKSARRLIAAHAVRSFVRQLAKEEKKTDDEKQFERSIAGSNIPNYLDYFSTLLPAKNKKTLRMSVSPFPEDRMLFSVLSKASQITKRIKIKRIDTPWGEPTTTQRDVSLINELVRIPQVAEASKSSGVFRHSGYYVLSSEDYEGEPKDRVKRAFALGLGRYQLGEYAVLLDKMRRKYEVRADAAQTGQLAPDWTKDFESFVAGKANGGNIYLGGSVNARLLMRIWKLTGRVFILCLPEDFKAALGRYPANRMVLGSDLQEAIPKQRRGNLQQRLLRVFRESADFIHSAGMNARSDPAGWGRPVIRYFLSELSPKEADTPRGILWNFAATEDDVVKLILDDNDFALAQG